MSSDNFLFAGSREMTHDPSVSRTRCFDFAGFNVVRCRFMREFLSRSIRTSYTGEYRQMGVNYPSCVYNCIGVVANIR